MKKSNYLSIVILIGLLALIAGCQDSQVLNPIALSDSITADAIGVSAPGAVVTGLGTFETTGGASIIRESGPGINELGNEVGTCESGGAWRNPGGNLSGSVPHANCTTTEQASLLNVTFSQNANLVYAKNGNINLNFKDIDDAYIHYQVRQNRTKGEGFILAVGDDDSEWVVDLSQVNANSNWFDNNPLQLTAFNGDDIALLIISW